MSEDTVADAINAALQPLREQIDAHQRARADDLRQLNNTRFRVQVGVPLVQAGARPETLPYLLERAGEYFHVVDEDVVAKPMSLSTARPSDPLPISEWIESAKQALPFAFTGHRSNNGSYRTRRAW